MINVLCKIKNVIIRRLDIYIRIPNAHRKFKRIRILDSLTSLQYIIDHKCSVSRYGDGEIVMMFGGVFWIPKCRWLVRKASVAGA